jgi:FixJ family two-component response regulator
MMNAGGSPRRVCIIDDEPGVRDLLELICASSDLATTTFDSAEAFLAGPVCRASDFDLVVLDVDMPGMSGLELLRTLKLRGYLQPVVMISGGLDAAKMAAATKLGAAAFFDKPFDIHAVSRCLSELAGDDSTSELRREARDASIATNGSAAHRLRSRGLVAAPAKTAPPAPAAAPRGDD